MKLLGGRGKDRPHASGVCFPAILSSILQDMPAAREDCLYIKICFMFLTMEYEEKRQSRAVADVSALV